MNVEVRWDNVPSYRSAEVQPIIQKEVMRLERHFRDPGSLDVHFRQEGDRYRAQVHAQVMGRDWWVTGEGDNLGQGLTFAFEALMRKVSEFKRFTKDRIHRRFQRGDMLTMY